MRIIRKEEIKQLVLSTSGEMIFEMIGRPPEIGGTIKNSVVHIVIPSGKTSAARF
jgi:hypothetical protein